MANDPFRQLDVIRNIARQGRVVRDCYRLLYKRELFGETSSAHVDDIIERLKAGAYRFAPNAITDGDRRLRVVIDTVLGAVYPPPTEFAYALERLRATPSEVTHWLTFELEPDVQALERALRRCMDDERFVRLARGAYGQRGACDGLQRTLRHIAFAEIEGTLANLCVDGALHVVRVDNTYVIGVAGSKQRASATGKCVRVALQADALPFTVNVTHVERWLRVGAYDVRFRTKAGERVLECHIPASALDTIAARFGYGCLHPYGPRHRDKLLRWRDEDIIACYEREFSWIARRYRFADDTFRLGRLFALGRGSLVKTLARKRDGTVAEARKKWRRHRVKKCRCD